MVKEDGSQFMATGKLVDDWEFTGCTPPNKIMKARIAILNLATSKSVFIV
jgi:hypothetical protein